jgi:hypothetical protein
MHTDHDGLSWECPFHMLHMLPPPEKIETLTNDGSRKLKTPMTAEDTINLKHALQSLEGQLVEFNTKVQSHLVSMTDPAPDTIDV